MRSQRYTFALTDAQGRPRRRVGTSRLALTLCAAAMITTAALAGLLVGGSEEARLAALLADNEALRLENQSYLEATRELTSQITNLQSAITELSTLAELDPATRRAIDRLPAIVRARAMGGEVSSLSARAVVTPSPERTFSRLQSVLDALESGLQSVRVRFENEQALARATPTLWPTVGWLSSAFGNRKDPFTGHPDFHGGSRAGRRGRQLCRCARQLRAVGPARSRLRAGDALRAPVDLHRACRPVGQARRPHRLCRFDRPGDQCPPALRGAPERGANQPVAAADAALNAAAARGLETACLPRKLTGPARIPRIA
jgi:hypothetical protein